MIAGAHADPDQARGPALRLRQQLPIGRAAPVIDQRVAISEQGRGPPQHPADGLRQIRLPRPAHRRQSP